MFKNTTKVIILIMLILVALLVGGCSSNRKDELRAKLQEGEQLLQEENFETAYLLYVNLLEEYQDNLTIMEKIDYTKTMKESRKNLALAKKTMDNNNFHDTVAYLKKLPVLDKKALIEKDKIIKIIKEEYFKKSDAYLAENSYEEAMNVLKEYGALLGEDPEMKKQLDFILVEREKPVETLKKVIVIDVAHQQIPNKEEEPIGLGSEIMGRKVSPGTQGVVTKVPEYELALDLAWELKEMLTSAGYQVYLTRETNQVNMSNIERSAFATEMQADLFLRLHANSSRDSSKQGIEILYPSDKNYYVGNLSLASEKLAIATSDELVKATGAKSQGVVPKENMAEHNFSPCPVITVLVGYMTNKEEDVLLQSKEYQQKISEGIKNGIDTYFETP